MQKKIARVIGLFLIVAVLGNFCLGGSEVVIEDAVYRNQVLDYPNWRWNIYSCGYTCVTMELLRYDLVPKNMTEQEVVEYLYDKCGITIANGDYCFSYGRVKNALGELLPGVDLQIDSFDSDLENNITKAIDEGKAVIVGTDLFGGAGHVILIVGYDADNWIVFDPALDWTTWDGRWLWARAAGVKYPKHSRDWNILYGLTIGYEQHKNLSAKIVDQSPTAILSANEMAMLWVRVKNTGEEAWTREDNLLGTFFPQDRNSGLIYPDNNRWKNSNRIMMEQEKVGPGQEAVFGVPVTTNGLSGEFPESFRLVKDAENGGWYGPIISWRVVCRQDGNNINNPQNNELTANSQFIKKTGLIHNHTKTSDGQMSEEELANEAKKLKLGFVCFSDHAEYLKNQQDFINYATRVGEAGKKTGMCCVLGMEYTIVNFPKGICQPTESTVHVLGLGYNKNNQLIVPPFLPWSEAGPKTTIADLIKWHYQNGLPVILCHPLIVGKNGHNMADMIEKFGTFDPLMITALEFFDLGLDSGLTVNNANKMIDPSLDFSRNLNLYRDYLMPAGAGVSSCSDYHGKLCTDTTKDYLGSGMCLQWSNQNQVSLVLGNQQMSVLNGDYGRLLQSLDRAKTTIYLPKNNNQLNPQDVIEALINKRMTAARYHERFDWIKVNGQEIAPGRWDNLAEIEGDLKLEGQIQFHENSSQPQDREKRILIYRNGNLVANFIKKLDASDKLVFDFTEDNLPAGVHNWVLAISGLEINDWAREKIISSPIYIQKKDESNQLKPENIDQNLKKFIICKEIRHLGDSFYNTPINTGFAKKNDEGKVGEWCFDLKPEYLNGAKKCQLAMTIRGAQILSGLNCGNPILLNDNFIGYCLVKDQSLENNGKYHYYNIPLEYLRSDMHNLIMIRSMSHRIKPHGVNNTEIDYDDFEIGDAALLIEYGGTAQKATVQALPKYFSGEVKEFEVEKNFSDEEKKESAKMLAEFKKMNGSFLDKNDPKAKQFTGLMKPIENKIENFDRYKSIEWEMFSSPTLDIISLPDGKLLVPSGLMDYYNQELPEDIAFPVISAMVLADKGIAHDQANRKDWLKIVGTIGLALTGNKQSEIAQWLGLGMTMVSALSLKTEDTDYFIGDACALDMLKKYGMDENDAISYLDALNTYEKTKNDKNKKFYLFAPEPQKRLETILKYHQVKKCLGLPIKPEEIDWER